MRKLTKNFFKNIKRIIFLCFTALSLNQCSNQNPTNTFVPAPKINSSLNAYSFNELLIAKKLSIDELFEFCVETGFDAVDLTAYYIPGYPEVPSDECLYEIKKKAFLLGLEISGTGVRNDFVHRNPDERKKNVDLVKNWIIAAEKLGAPVIRIFAGIPDDDHQYNQMLEYVLQDIQECVEFGKSHGVVVAIQNHWDFIKNPDQIDEIFQRIDSDWFGLILDIGSFKSGDPYDQIARVLPHAVSWQIKEKIYVDGVEQKVDLIKLMKLIKISGYRGYIPIETLGEGDPFQKVDQFYKEVIEARNEVFFYE
jgi:sugar phosphate isomerase/epimerase